MKKGLPVLKPDSPFPIKKAAGLVCPRLLFPIYSLIFNGLQADLWVIIVVIIVSA
jgi:hypothetical protein